MFHLCIAAGSILTHVITSVMNVIHDVMSVIASVMSVIANNFIAHPVVCGYSKKRARDRYLLCLLFLMAKTPEKAN